MSQSAPFTVAQGGVRSGSFGVVAPGARSAAFSVTPDTATDQVTVRLSADFTVTLVAQNDARQAMDDVQRALQGYRRGTHAAV